MKEEIIIVDEEDNIIGYKDRLKITQNDIYRVSALWIENSNGEILLAQRSFKKKNNPGKWGPAVAGTVEKGETYEQNIEKETQEELGLSNIQYKELEFSRHIGNHNYFGKMFYAIIDKDIEDYIIQKEEVEQIKRFKKDELILELEDNPDKFLTSINKYINY